MEPLAVTFRHGRRWLIRVWPRSGRCKGLLHLVLTIPADVVLEDGTATGIMCS